MMNLLDLPDCMLEQIFEYLSYDQISQNRLVRNYSSSLHSLPLFCAPHAHTLFLIIHQFSFPLGLCANQSSMPTPSECGLPQNDETTLVLLEKDQSSIAPS